MQWCPLSLLILLASRPSCTGANSNDVYWPSNWEWDQDKFSEIVEEHGQVGAVILESVSKFFLSLFGSDLEEDRGRYVVWPLAGVRDEGVL